MQKLRHRCYCVITGLLIIMIAGCAGPRLTLKSENEIYPKEMRSAAPFVLAIPGLNLPHDPIRQEQHFGNLVQMLADKGIPSKVLAYDTDENPLTPVANLSYDETSIAVTRVTPYLENEVEIENARRAQLNLPPVKELIVFSFSQGSVMASRIVTRINYFKKSYASFCKRFGQEWCALQKDPEFLFLMSTLSDYIAIHDIKVQREKEFLRDRDLQILYTRLQKKYIAQSNDFRQYLIDPQKKYPDVVHFEPPESPKYPKFYPKLNAFLKRTNHSPTAREKVRKFLIGYASFDNLLDVEIRFISTAGSFFGSLNADWAYALAESFPPAKRFIGRELNQIKDTRLGSEHQLESVRYLYECVQMGWYPYQYDNTLFILGVNGDDGDGMVDQSAAHLADHLCVGVVKGKGGVPRQVVEKLPDFEVVPLQVTHMPQNTLFGKTYGAAYMVPGNPVFEYLVDFINKDWAAINKRLAGSNLQVRQFMVQAFSFKENDQRVMLHFKRKGNSANVTIDDEYRNPDSGAVVWSGRFTGKEDYMNLTGPEAKNGTVTFEYWTRPDDKTTVEVPITPGCNTFVAVQAE